jgi:hypothetical protein
LLPENLLPDFAQKDQTLLFPEAAPQKINYDLISHGKCLCPAKFPPLKFIHLSLLPESYSPHYAIFVIRVIFFFVKRSG